MRHKNTIIKKEILILIGLIIILNVIVVLGQTDNQISSIVPSIDDWNLESNIQVSNYITQILRDDSAINKFREQFNALDDNKKLLIWNRLITDPPIYDDSGKKIPYATNKKFLREIVFKNEETTKKFLEALDSSSNVNDEYKFLSSVIKKDDELIKQTFNAFDLEPNKREERYARLWDSFYNQDKNEIDIESRNKIVGLLNKEQFQTLMKAVTKKNIELATNFDEKSFGYELKDGNPVFTLKKGGGLFLIPEKNLPDNLEKIVFKEITEGNKKGQYGVFYKTSEIGGKGNTAMLQQGYLQKSDNKNEWNVFGLNKEIFEGGKAVVGLDPKAGQVEIASDGKIEMWGTGHSTGKDGVYVEINGQRFFPSKVSPQTEDKAYRYAFVNPLEKDVFNLKGNMQAKVDGKGVGLYIYNTENGVVSLKEGYVPKENENLITLSSGGLDIKGTALNGKVSFSVSEDMKLTTSKGTFNIKPKDGEGNYYSYNPIVPTAKGELIRFVESGKGLEYVPITKENTQFTGGEKRVDDGRDTNGNPSSHISPPVQEVVEGTPTEPEEKGKNWGTATETKITEGAIKTEEGTAQSDYKRLMEKLQNINDPDFSFATKEEQVKANNEINELVYEKITPFGTQITKEQYDELQQALELSNNKFTGSEAADILTYKQEVRRTRDKTYSSDISTDLTTNEGQVIMGDVGDKETITTNVKGAELEETQTTPKIYGLFERNNKNIPNYAPSSTEGYFKSSLGAGLIEYTTIEKLTEISSSPTQVTITEPSWCGYCRTEIRGGAEGPFITGSQARKMGFEPQYYPQKVKVQNGKIIK